jgi:hypothetical protein
MFPGLRIEKETRVFMVWNAEYSPAILKRVTPVSSQMPRCMEVWR